MTGSRQPERVGTDFEVLHVHDIDRKKGRGATQCLEEKMEKIDLHPFLSLWRWFADTGAGIYACKVSTNVFELTKDDLIEQGMDTTVDEFSAMATKGEIIFT